MKYFSLKLMQITRLNSKSTLIGYYVITIILRKVYYVAVLPDACRLALYCDLIISLKVISGH
jgi:hypothetical protein